METPEYGYDPARLKTALNLLAAVCEPGDSVADLGCLHGAYTLEFARAGYRATGIDARPEHIGTCRRNAPADSPWPRYICGDVRDIADHGRFGAVFCCGLLYHLDKPVKFLKVLGQVTGRLLIVQTHFELAPAEVHEGYAGGWHDEEGRDNPWAAWENDRSFWLSRAALLTAIQFAGFDLVAELHDSRADICGSWSRGMFAGIRP